MIRHLRNLAAIVFFLALANMPTAAAPRDECVFNETCSNSRYTWTNCEIWEGCNGAHEACADYCGKTPFGYSCSYWLGFTSGECQCNLSCING